MFARVVGFLVAMLTCQQMLAQDSNRNDVRANLEKDGWTVVWGKNFTEADWAEGSKSIAESVAAENPGPFLKWFTQVLNENFNKIKNNLPGVLVDELERIVLQSLKQRQIVQIQGLRLEAGFATYNRWKNISADVPTGKVIWKGIDSKVETRTIRREIPLPNWHQFYVRYKIIREEAQSRQNNPQPATPQAVWTFPGPYFPFRPQTPYHEFVDRNNIKFQDYGGGKWILWFPNGTHTKFEEAFRFREYIELKEERGATLLRIFDNRIYKFLYPYVLPNGQQIDGHWYTDGNMQGGYRKLY